MTEALSKDQQLLRGPSDWKPMDTAPKDTAVLIYAFAYHVAYYRSDSEQWVIIDLEGEPEATRWLWRTPPTAWMPLPEEPRS